MNSKATHVFRLMALGGCLACLSGCAPQGQQGAIAPLSHGVDTSQQQTNNLAAGHRLIRAGEYELALSAFNRAALRHGLNGEILMGMGSANLGLERLGQAETLLRRAAEVDPENPAIANNLGVVLMGRGKYAEAAQVLKRAYALDNGESDAIRENLRLALEKFDNPATVDPKDNEYKLVLQGAGDYKLSPVP